MKPDNTLIAAYGPMGYPPHRMWSALYNRKIKSKRLPMTCYNVVFGSKSGPLITEETAFKLARKLLEKDPELLGLYGVRPGKYWRSE